MSGTNGTSGNNGAIDWNTELRRIERQFDGLPSRTQIRMQKVQEIVDRSKLEERLAVVGVWTRLLLIAAVTVALFWWPYGHGCGWRLGAFLGAEGVVIVAGLLLARVAWNTRQGVVLAGSAFFVLTAWTVIAVQSFPNVRVDLSPRPSVIWICSS